MFGRILLAMLCVVLGLLLVALLIPAYIRVSYDRGELCVYLNYATMHIPLYPRKQKEAGSEEKAQEEDPSEKKEAKPKKGTPKINWEQVRYSLEKLPPVLLKALKRTGRRIRVCPLKVHVLVAGTDPADTAVLYGKLEAALAASLPLLHRLVRIREQDICLFPDFCEEKMDCIADVGVGIRPWDLLVVALGAAVGVIKWLIGFKKRAAKVTGTDKKSGQTTAQAETAA